MVWFKERSKLPQKSFSAPYYMSPDSIFGRAVRQMFFSGKGGETPCNIKKDLGRVLQNKNNCIFMRTGSFIELQEYFCTFK